MKALIFDLDGTLLDTIRDIGEAMNKALILNGFKPHDIKEYPSFLGNGAIVLTKKAINAPCSDEVLNKVLNEYRNFYIEDVCVYTKPFKDVISVLKELKKRGYFLGVISNKPDFESQKLINLFFKDIFNYASGKKDEVKRKPDCEALEIMARKCNLNKEDIIYIGDSHVDSEFSHNYGCPYYLFTYGYESKERLKTLDPVLFLDEFKELLEVFR